MNSSNDLFFSDLEYFLRWSLHYSFDGRFLLLHRIDLQRRVFQISQHIRFGLVGQLGFERHHGYKGLDMA